MDRNQGEHPEDAESDDEDVAPVKRRKPPARGVEPGEKRTSRKSPSVSRPNSEIVPTERTLYFDLDYNIAAALCYFPLQGVASILWLVTEKNASQYLKFHAVQSLVLTAALIGFNVVSGTIIAITRFLPVIGDGLGLVLTLVQGLFGLIFYGLCFRLAFGIYKGKDGRLPIVADFSDRIVESYL